MQLAARKALDPEQTIVVVLTSGGLKDPGAEPDVAARGARRRRRLRRSPVLRDGTVCATLMDSRWTASLGRRAHGRGLRRRTSSSGRARPSAPGSAALWIIEDYFHPGPTRWPPRPPRPPSASRSASAWSIPTRGIRRWWRWRRPRWPASRPAASSSASAAATGGGSRRRWRSRSRRRCGGLREGVDDRAPPARGRARDATPGSLLDPRRRARVTTAGARSRSCSASRARGRWRWRREVADGVHCSILASRRRTCAACAPAPPGAGARGLRRPRVRADGGRTTDGAGRARGVRPLLARYLGALHGQSILRRRRPRARADAAVPRRARPRARPPRELVTDEMIDALAVAGTPEHAGARSSAGPRPGSTRRSRCCRRAAE